VNVCAAKSILKLWKQSFIGEGDDLRVMVPDLFNQKGQIATGGESHNLELFWELLGDLQSLSADRARGAQHADGFHVDLAVGFSFPCRTLANFSQLKGSQSGWR